MRFLCVEGAQNLHIGLMGFRGFYEHSAYESMQYLLRSSSISMAVGTPGGSAPWESGKPAESQSQTLQTGTLQASECDWLVYFKLIPGLTSENFPHLFFTLLPDSFFLFFPCDFSCRFSF